MLHQLEDRLRKHINSFKPHKRTKYEKYIIPFVLVVLVILAKFFLRTFVSEQTSYHLLTLIIILSAFYGGLRSGLFATVLVTVSEAIFFLPRNESYFGVYNILSTLILLIGGIYISFISDLKQRAELQKDGFIGFASHELKTPLTAIQAYTQLLLKSKHLDDEKAKEILQNIVKQTKNAVNLINELLDITKIETGKLFFNKTKCSIDEVVRETVHAQQVITPSHKITFKGTSTKKIYADKMRLQQVLSNLISNAVKYSPGKAKIVVETQSIDGEVVVRVQDFGQGISKADQLKIFDPFYRAKNTQTTKGAGIGLYLASQIAQKHNGRIEVESKVGSGSTFSLHLPTTH